MNKINWEKLAEFANENKDIFIVFASPRTDEIYSSFNGLKSFVKFPMESMDKGVIFNALRKSKFEVAIDPFMAGFMESTGIKETEEGGELLKVIGGNLKALGVGKSEVTNKKNAKTKKK